MFVSRWTYKAVVDRIRKLELPSDHNLEGKERLLLDCDPHVVALTEALTSAIAFFSPLHHLVMTGHVGFTNAADFTVKTLVHLFAVPLAYLDLGIIRDSDNNKRRRLAGQIVAMIDQLCKDPMSLLNGVNNKSVNDNKSDTSDDDEDATFPLPVPLTGIATLYYCYYAEHMSDCLPLVYSPHHILLQCLPAMCALLATSQLLAQHKALRLAQALTHRIDGGTLACVTLDAAHHHDLVNHVTRVLTLSQNKELRDVSFVVFKRHLSILDIPGRYRMFVYLLQTVQHAGLQGYVITQIKENIAVALLSNKHNLDNRQSRRIHTPSNDALQSHDNYKRVSAKYGNGTQDTECEVFLGTSMWSLVYEAAKLPDGETTDLLDRSDRLLAVLNLIIFLFIRAKKETVDSDGGDKQRKLTSLDNSNKCQQVEDGMLTDDSNRNFGGVMSGDCKDSCNVSDDCTTTCNDILGKTFEQANMRRHVDHLDETLLVPLTRGLDLSRDHYQLKLKQLQTGSGGEAEVELEILEGQVGGRMEGFSLEDKIHVVELSLSRLDMLNCVVAQCTAASADLNGVLTT